MNKLDDITNLRDALDHIARIANASRQKTHRLSWIFFRARNALHGKEWNKNDFPEPKKASIQEVHDLRATIFMLIKAYESKDIKIIEESVKNAKDTHLSLFRKNEDVQLYVCAVHGTNPVG